MGSTYPYVRAWRDDQDLIMLEVDEYTFTIPDLDALDVAASLRAAAEAIEEFALPNRGPRGATAVLRALNPFGRST